METPKKYIMTKMPSREEIEEIIDEVALSKDLSEDDIREIAGRVAPDEKVVLEFFQEIRGTFFIDDYTLRSWADRLERILR